MLAVGQLPLEKVIAEDADFSGVAVQRGMRVVMQVALQPLGLSV